MSKAQAIKDLQKQRKDFETAEGYKPDERRMIIEEIDRRIAELERRLYD